MEFFEKAHVPRTDHKPKKSDELRKRQFKRMLHGYKEGDNETIKHCAGAEYESDSSSVSGISDLNLTNSSNENINASKEILGYNDDVIQEIISSIDDGENKLEHENNFNDNESGSKMKYEDPHRGDGSPKCLSTSEDNDDVLSDTSFYHLRTRDFIKISKKCTSSVTISDSDSTMEILSSESDEDATQFDADGALASKILKKIKSMERNKKVNLSKSEKEETQDEIDEIHSDSFNVDFESMDLDSMEEVSLKPLVSDSGECDSLDSFDTSSSAFVSVEVEDMPKQTFNEILGDYRHPTMKNTPSKTCDVRISMENNVSFSNECVSNDIDIEEGEGTLDEEDSKMEQVGYDTTDLSMDVPNENTVITNETSDENFVSTEEQEDSIESSFTTSIQLYYGRNNCIFILKHPTEIFIHGKVKVRALGGTVEVLGYTVKDGPYEIYAPYYNYAQHLKTVEGHNVYYGLFGKLTNLGLSVIEAEEIVTTLGKHDSVVCLSPLIKHQMDFVEHYFTKADLFSKRSKHVDSMLLKASEKLQCSLYSIRPGKSFKEYNWEDIIRFGYCEQSKGIVCGGKGAGKSTFLRYYVNRLLERGPVLVIDLDPGQCEFTVAGNMSVTIVDKPLLGPSFTHLKIPEKMLNIGIINTMENTMRYAAAVGELIAHCHTTTRYQNMPWIINTMGMTNSMGLKFMTLIVLLARPTFLMQINTNNENRNFSFNLDSNTIKNYHVKYQKDRMFANVACPWDLDYKFFLMNKNDVDVKNFSLAPREERYLNFLAYFGLSMRKHNGPGILGIAPYEVKLDNLCIVANIEIHQDMLSEVLNGKIIALCQHTADSSVKMFALADKPILCHGHGVIRGIDNEKGVLYIITPISMNKLMVVNTLLYAEWVPELQDQEEHLEGVKIPYRTASQYDQRQLMLSPRRRFNVLQILKMSKIS